VPAQTSQRAFARSESRPKKGCTRDEVKVNTEIKNAPLLTASPDATKKGSSTWI